MLVGVWMVLDYVVRVVAVVFVLVVGGYDVMGAEAVDVVVALSKETVAVVAVVVAVNLALFVQVID